MTNYYEDGMREANRGAVMEDMLDMLQAAQKEIDQFRSAAPQWVTPAEMLPDNPIPVLAYWQEDGVWVAQYYPEKLQVYRDGATQPAVGWYTIFDDSDRPAPVCWCYPPSPAGMVCDMWRDAQ